MVACKGSLRRLGMDQIGIAQLHWSTANYQPLQERALWDGLVALHDQVTGLLHHVVWLFLAPWYLLCVDSTVIFHTWHAEVAWQTISLLKDPVSVMRFSAVIVTCLVLIFGCITASVLKCIR